MESSAAASQMFTSIPQFIHDQKECPICFTRYGKQPDDTFLCRDGIDNSDFKTDCTHYICVICAREMSRQEEIKCPLCREDWTDWMHSHYYTDSDDDSNDDDDCDCDDDSDGDSEDTNNDSEDMDYRNDDEHVVSGSNTTVEASARSSDDY